MRTVFLALCLIALVLAASGARALTDAEATYQFVASLTGLATSSRAPTQAEIANCLTNNAGLSNGAECHNNMVRLELDINPSTITLPEVPSGATGSQIKVSKIDLDCAGDNTVCYSQFPSSWVTLSNLQELIFDDIQLSGSLPADWTQMTSLNKLDLSDGTVTGALPTLPSTMRDLDMGKNSFCGTLPDSWASLPLNDFDMEVWDTSKLCGCTSSWASNSKLRDELQDLGFNKNTGCSTVKPTCDGTCGTTAGGSGGSGGNGGSGSSSSDADATYQFVAALTQLDSAKIVPTQAQIADCLTSNVRVSNVVDCNNNMVRLDLDIYPGAITLPAVPTNAGAQIKVSKIELDCRTNACTAQFPSSWVTLSNLQELIFDDFQLSGSLPADWTQMTSLNKLDLSEGTLTGALPTLPSTMRDLDMGKNSFCGTLPDSWASLPLNSFDMEVWDTSKLCGCTSSWASNSKLRDELQDLGFNKNTGCSTVKPTCDGTCGTTAGGNGSDSKESPTLRFLRVLGKSFRPTYNQWSGDNWLGWTGISGSDGAVVVNLTNVALRGALPQIPDDLDGSQVNVISIDLSGSATVVGTLPASWGNLTQLQTLTLSDTLISGTLPAAWSTMTALNTLTIRNTLLCGALPDWAMPELQTVDLSNNKYLRGSLNPSWASMPKLKQVTLGTNAFCGTVPQQWSTITLTSTRSEYPNCSEELNKCNSGSFQLTVGTALVAVLTVLATSFL